MIFTTAFLVNRVPHKALGMFPYRRMDRKNQTLRMLRTIEARFFVHVETYTTKMAAKTWEGHLHSYSTDSRAYHVYNPAARKVTESRNVTFTDTPPHDTSSTTRKTTSTSRTSTTTRFHTTYRLLRSTPPTTTARERRLKRLQGYQTTIE